MEEMRSGRNGGGVRGRWRNMGGYIKPQTSTRTSAMMPKVTTEDAENYTLTIKNIFLCHPENYCGFNESPIVILQVACKIMTA
uniref:Uncharacterized protein n=1 Tax=Oryza meridionalis TaxID=40149 RepID=A0A0E0EKI5_9ORYZ